MISPPNRNGNGNGKHPPDDEAYPGSPEPLPGKCGKKKKQGSGYCILTAGHGTDHFGNGACKFHGGATPIVSGRYSRIQRETLTAAIASYASDPDPLNLLPELAALRAHYETFVNRHEELVEALLEWNADAVRNRKKPQRIPSIETGAKLLSEISRVVTRIEKIRSGNAISRPQLFRLLREFAASVRRHNEIEDPDERLRRIEDDWRTIAL